MGAGTMIASMLAGAADQYGTNRANEIRSEDKAKLEQAREEKMMALQQRYQTSEREASQAYGTSEREASQGYQAGENEKNRQFQTSERLGSQSFQAGQNALSRQSQENMNSERVAAKGKTEAAQAAADDKDDKGNPVPTDGSPFLQNGQWMVYESTKQGLMKKPAPKYMRDQLIAQTNAAQTDQATSASKDIEQLKANIASGDTTGLTGLVINASNAGGDYQSRMGSEKSRESYQLAQRIQANAGNLATSAAQSSGVSGINTIAEAERIAKGAPALDYSSDTNLNNSLHALQNYYVDQANQLRRTNGLDPLTQKDMTARMGFTAGKEVGKSDVEKYVPQQAPTSGNAAGAGYNMKVHKRFNPATGKLEAVGE